MWIDEAPRVPDDIPVIMHVAQTSTASAPKNSRLKVGVCEYMTSDSITLEPKIVAGQKIQHSLKVKSKFVYCSYRSTVS